MDAVIIGAGRMGRRHVAAAMAAGLNVSGISDISANSLAEAQKEGMAAENCFFDTAAMLSARKPELVIVATTATSHAELVLLALDAGAKYILCEKPLAVSLRQAEEMIAACAARSVRLGVNHQMRYMERHTAVKELAYGEVMGGLHSVSITAGNIGLAMNGLHYFEMFRYMTDALPLVCQAWFDDGNVSNPRGPQFLDKAGQIRLENGAGQRFYMDAGSKQSHGLVVTYGCAYGHIIVDELAGIMTVTHREAEHRLQPSTRYGMPWQRYERQIAPADVVVPTAAVLNDLLHGTQWPDGECGLNALRVLVAAYLSAENGHMPVMINGDLPKERVFPWA